MSTYYRIQSTDRHGISVCDSREELAEYLAQTGIPFDGSWELLEVEGYDSDEDDEDAHLGARLIIPTAIISRESVDDGFDIEIFDAYDMLAAA